MLKYIYNFVFKTLKYNRNFIFEMLKYACNPVFETLRYTYYFVFEMLRYTYYFAKCNLISKYIRNAVVAWYDGPLGGRSQWPHPSQSYHNRGARRWRRDLVLLRAGTGDGRSWASGLHIRISTSISWSGAHWIKLAAICWREKLRRAAQTTDDRLYRSYQPKVVSRYLPGRLWCDFTAMRRFELISMYCR